jgi:hypothetical protein
LLRQYLRVLTNNRCVRGAIPPPCAGTTKVGPAELVCGQTLKAFATARTGSRRWPGICTAFAQCTGAWNWLVLEWRKVICDLPKIT